MKIFSALIGAVAANWRVLALFLASTFLFLLFLFPFSDLSDLVTSAVARATGNQVYIQAESLDLHLVPQPAVSASNLSVETSLPAIEAKWAKVTPGIFSTLLNIGTFMKAANGDPEASRAAMSKLSLSVDAEGVWGGDVGASLRPGKRSEQGKDMSRLSLAVEKIDLSQVQRWAELPLRIQGQASLDTDMQMAFDFSEQPEGDFSLKVNKFALPASTVSIPMGEGASFPLNIPSLTLANVILKGRLVGGNLVIEEGVFGKAGEALSGRIKGQMGLRLQPMGNSVTPIFSAYNLTVDLNTSSEIQKELGFAFLPLDSAKTPTGAGGARYLFRATGQGVGMAFVPQITRVETF